MQTNVTGAFELKRRSVQSYVEISISASMNLGFILP